MRRCENCSEPTKNPRFCSLSCGTKWQHAAKPWPIGYCTRCGSAFSRRRAGTKVYCSRSCAASVNNHKHPKRTSRFGSGASGRCAQCGAFIPKRNTYCGNACRADLKRAEFIQGWIDGTVSGLTSIGLLATPLKNWLIDQRGPRCELCGWGERNITTGNLCLIADHTDGIWQNNRPENIRLLCPNCDSLQPTYKALNVGNGRAWRRV